MNNYQATRNEKDTTRGRANTLREFLTLDKKENAFDHPEVFVTLWSQNQVKLHP